MSLLRDGDDGDDGASPDDPLLPEPALLEAPLPMTVHLTVMVVGEAGVGKSTLARLRRRPPDHLTHHPHSSSSGASTPLPLLLPLLLSVSKPAHHHCLHCLTTREDTATTCILHTFSCSLYAYATEYTNELDDRAPWRTSSLKPCRRTRGTYGVRCRHPRGRPSTLTSRAGSSSTSHPPEEEEEEEAAEDTCTMTTTTTTTTTAAADTAGRGRGERGGGGWAR